MRGRTILFALSFSLPGCAGAQAAPARLARVSLVCGDGSAELTVDGVPRGTAGDYAGARKLLLAPGTHRLEVRAPGAAVETRELTVGAGDEITLTMAPRPF